MTSDEKELAAKKAHVAWLFIQSQPEYPPTPENSFSMLRYIENFGMEYTVENLRTAFGELKKAGKIEFPTASNEFQQINVGTSIFSTPLNTMSMEEAQAQLEAQEIQVNLKSISSMTDPMLKLPSGKQTVVWDKDFAMNKLKGPVISEPKDSKPILVEKKPRRFKE